jgi:hypothetical protein
METPADAPQAPPFIAPTPPVKETPGATLRRLHLGVHPTLRDFSCFVADYIDGIWLPSDDDTPAKVAVALGRKLLARETELSMLKEVCSKAEDRAASLEAQLCSLLGEDGATVRLREELGEARAALAALQETTGERMSSLFETYSANLAEENADLKAKLASQERELVELKEVLLEMRRAGGQDRTELDLFGEQKAAGLKKVNQGGGGKP